MNLLYFKLAIAGILGGLVMVVSGLELYWQGALAILAGLVAFALGIRNVAAKNPAGDRPPGAPYTADDFRPDVKPTGPSGLRCIITTSAEEPAVWLVTYGEFMSFVISADPARMSRGAQLKLAFRATSGAEMEKPVEVGQENRTGLLEDDYHWYQCRVAPTPANTTALRAVGFAWDDDAQRLADQFGIADETVTEVRRNMHWLAQQDLENARRIRE